MFFSTHEAIIFCILFAIIGVFAGFIGALFSVGGGTILVPAFLLVYKGVAPVLEIDMHQAVGTSLVLVILNGVISTLRHVKTGNLDWNYFRGWAFALLIGAILGGIVMAHVSSMLLKLMFFIYIICAICYEVCRRYCGKKTRIYKPGPHGVIKMLFGMGFGAASLLLGMAGGTLVTPFFTFFNYPIRKAMAIAGAGGIIIGGIGTVAAILSGVGVVGRLPFSWGYVNWLSVLIVAPFVILSSPWGVRCAYKISENTLQLLYIWFLSLLACYLLIEFIL